MFRPYKQTNTHIIELLKWLTQKKRAFVWPWLKSWVHFHYTCCADTHWQKHTHTQEDYIILPRGWLWGSLRHTLRELFQTHTHTHTRTHAHTHTHTHTRRIKPILRGFRVHQHSIEISDQIHFDMLDVSSTTVAMVTKWSTTHTHTVLLRLWLRNTVVFKVSVRMYVEI